MYKNRVALSVAKGPCTTLLTLPALSPITEELVKFCAPVEGTKKTIKNKNYAANSLCYLTFLTYISNDKEVISKYSISCTYSAVMRTY